MLLREDNAVRVSTVALLTLSALAAQNLTQQATANLASNSVPNQPSPADQDAHTSSAEASVAYTEASPPEFLPDHQFAPIPETQPVQSVAASQGSPSPTTTETATTITTVALPALLPTDDSPKEPRISPLSQDMLSGAIDIPVKPFQPAQIPTKESDPGIVPTLTSAELTTPVAETPVRPLAVPVEVRPNFPPGELTQTAPLPGVTVSQRNRTLPRFVNSGIRQRRVSVRNLQAVRVTNRTSRSILIELVGRTSPLRLAPGQTRTLRANPRDLSLLYWDPILHTGFDARLSQSDQRVLGVDLLPSNYPIGSFGIYLPEPVRRPDVVRIF